MKTANIDLCAAVIAGGYSKRFGSAKALALFRNRPLICTAIDLCNELSDKVFISADIQFPGIASSAGYVPDIIPDCGPLGGIYSVLKASPSPWIAIVPCDMPLLSVELYKFLIQHYKPAGNKPVIARSHNGLEPLVSIWPKSCFVDLNYFFRHKIFGLHKIIGELDSCIVDLPAKMQFYQPDWFVNINYRKDLENL